jgi:hypothetical protein
MIGHLLVGEIQGGPRASVRPERPASPRHRWRRRDGGGSRYRTIPVDSLVQELRVDPPSPIDGGRPQPLENDPGLPKAVGVLGTHLGPLRITAVELGLDQGNDIDAVDPQTLDLTADRSVGHDGAPDVHVDQGRGPNSGSAESTMLGQALTRSTFWNLASERATFSNRDPVKSSPVNSATTTSFPRSRLRPPRFWPSSTAFPARIRPLVPP